MLVYCSLHHVGKGRELEGLLVEGLLEVLQPWPLLQMLADDR